MPRGPNPFQHFLVAVRLKLRDAGIRLKVRRWLPPLVWAGVILFITSLPGPLVPRQLGPYDKVVHFVAYAVFGVLLSRDFAQVTSRWRSLVVAVLVAAAMGAADEWHQRFIPGRQSDVADWQADSIGAAGGALLFVLLRRPRTSRPSTAE